MKKLTKILFPLGASLLLASCSGGAAMDCEAAVKYSKEHYSEATVFENYNYVEYELVETNVTEYAKEVSGDDAATAKNQAALAEAKVLYGRETRNGHTYLGSDPDKLQPFFFGEPLLTELQDDYSSKDIKPTYEITANGGMKAFSTYSEAMGETTLTLLGAKSGGIACDCQAESDKLGCILTFTEAVAAVIDVDGDGEVDVQYTMRFSAAFRWSEVN